MNVRKYNALGAVKSAICTIRSMGKHPSYDRVRRVLLIAGDLAPSKSEICRLMPEALALLAREDGTIRPNSTAEVQTEPSADGNALQDNGFPANSTGGTSNDTKSYRQQETYDVRLDVTPSVSDETTGGQTALPGVVTDLNSRRKKRPKAREHDRSWVEPLRAFVGALGPRELRSLTSDERFELARYSAMRYANCAADERANRKHAARFFAPSLVNLATHREHGALTVREYWSAMHLAWQRGGSAPLRSAWAAVGSLDIEVPHGRPPQPPSPGGAYRSDGVRTDRILGRDGRDAPVDPRAPRSSLADVGRMGLLADAG